MVWTSRPVASLRGTIRAPGDKSCSHRAVLFGALAEGESVIRGLLESEDVLGTLAACRACGADVAALGAGNYRVSGVGAAGLAQPAHALDFGNSGTGVRLMMGVVAGQAITAEFIGDASLSARPMGRVLNPLMEMGATARSRDGMLPVHLTGGKLRAIDYAPPQASAQVKSALLLAALRAEGTTRITESKPTRDHTETMLTGFGVTVGRSRNAQGHNVVTLTGGQALAAIDVSVPGDPSSAAFAIAAALISPKGEVVVENVLSNETRDGLYRLLVSMGAELGAEDRGEAAGERVADLSAASSALRGVDVPEAIVPAMIDEFPLLGVLASFAHGVTRVTGAEELRVKESDRIRATVAMLRANGVEAEETPDGFIVQGSGGPPPGGGLVETRHDHRIAMSALVMGTAAQAPVSVDDIAMIATSYPEFLTHMRALGADIGEG